MDAEFTEVVRRVLREAALDNRFPKMSDGERLIWMIAQGYELGLQRRAATRRRRVRAVDMACFLAKKLDA